MDEKDTDDTDDTDDTAGTADIRRQLCRSERLSALGAMILDSAHECRNAFQQIQACLTLLESRTEGDEGARELIADLRKAQDRLHRLFEDALGLARLP
jgi:signal transduction histidine kinase